MYAYRCEKYKRRIKDGGGDDTVARNGHVDGDVSLWESLFLTLRLRGEVLWWDGPRPDAEDSRNPDRRPKD